MRGGSCGRVCEEARGEGLGGQEEGVREGLEWDERGEGLERVGRERGVRERLARQRQREREAGPPLRQAG